MILTLEIRRVENGFIIVDGDCEFVAENIEAVSKVISNRVEETFSDED